ncbi:hypothetical protein JOF56_010033 [Kibdelosporangium banguiense]|uniref:Uncharacterized protein n=1 Tax=Kibdelosporangium banguiense TaxID=1365924 RepID=A0ABS4U085_9PSEU|nr:hypothetical protein [Kibdelosporangium banguiense]
MKNAYAISEISIHGGCGDNVSYPHHRPAAWDTPAGPPDGAARRADLAGNWEVVTVTKPDRVWGPGHTVM